MLAPCPTPVFLLTRNIVRVFVLDCRQTTIITSQSATPSILIIIASQLITTTNCSVLTTNTALDN